MPHLRRRQWLRHLAADAGKALLERFALYKLHDDIRRAVFKKEIAYGDDAG